MSMRFVPELKMTHFEGPLDLLCHLIDKNKIDIHDIPIDSITDQYLEYLAAMKEIDLEVASDFLVMASGLLQIKSRMLLPKRDTAGQSDDADPREELVLRLLEYRRCKTLAGDLKSRYETYRDLAYRPPESPSSLGLEKFAPLEPVSSDRFIAAARQVSDQNRQRFSDLTGRIAQILKREKVSLRDKMRQILSEALRRTRVFFNELFPQNATNRNERVTAFLALLELLRLNRIRVYQEQPFDVILIETDGGITDPISLDHMINSDAVEEKEYA